MHKLIIAVSLSFFIFILWIIYLADTNGSSIFIDFVRSFPYGDKLGHFCLFGTLSFLAIIGTKFHTFSFAKLNIYTGVVLVSIFVLAEEISQAFIASRTFDLIDLASDSLGIIIAIGFAYLVNKHLVKAN